jgi:hypothetical protein
MLYIRDAPDLDTMMSMMDKSMGDHMDMKDDAMDGMEDDSMTDDAMEDDAMSDDAMEDDAMSDDSMKDGQMDSGMTSMKMDFGDATPLCLSPDTAEILTERGIDLTLLSTLRDTMMEKYDTMTMKDDSMKDDAMEDDARVTP